MKSSLLTRASVALGLFSVAYAQISQTCPSTSVCYSLNIPDETASSGSGDIYFQISAPTTYEWVALGQGTQMAGANMFIMYTSADGQNVTVSPRLGTGHVEPSNTGDTSQITLLEGSGVSNGTMLGNVLCSNCSSWSGGTMDFSSTSGTWIYAMLSGEALNSDDLNQDISMHDDYGSFDWDFVAATGGSDVNPFLASDDEGQTTTSNSTTSQAPSGIPSNIREIMIAHGVMASLAWVIFIPTGAIIVRIVPVANVAWVHAGIQMFGYSVYIAAFGMGVYMASKFDAFDHHHAIIGIVVFILASLQPLSGLLHHFGFRKTLHRNVWSVFHLTFGRAAVILGIINGGLGLQWANNASTGQVAAYGAVAGVFGVAYLISLVVGELRRNANKRAGKQDAPSRVEKDVVSRSSGSGSR